MKNSTTGLLVLSVIIILITGGYFVMKSDSLTVEQTPDQDVSESTNQGELDNNVVATSTEELEVDSTKTIIGTSVSGEDITAYHFGEGGKQVLFVGGIHGGYAWNTTLLAYEMMDYLTENPTAVPEGVKVTVIPVLNPDGLEKIVGTTGRFEADDVKSTTVETVPGRFNANNVDLNRNFDCDWQAKGTWQNTTVSGGTEVFSEPESQALREFVDTLEPTAVVVWYSAAGGVYSSSCHNEVSTETLTLTNLYAKASGYSAYEDFDFYEITGDMVNWLAKSEIPAISVLLTNHRDIEWEKNKAGIEALLEYYAD